MASDIVLSSGVRNNLLALQHTSEVMGKTEHRLATGLKVNSAIDNPGAFMTASSLRNRAGDLSTILDSMGQAIQTIEAADRGITAIIKLVESAKAKANLAATTTEPANRFSYAREYEELLEQIKGLAEDASYNGKNLLAGSGNNLIVYFNEDNTSQLEIKAVDYTDTDGVLGLLDADTAGDWADDVNVQNSIDQTTAALNQLRAQAATFGTNLTVVQNREKFTMHMINTLEVGADKLTLADTNEEGANLLALQTRQQLSSTALSMAAQSDQNVLRLFG